MQNSDRKSFYESMGIYELRNYARNIGVKSATSKNKNEIIENIVAIENGILEPINVLKKEKGRPAKLLKGLTIEYNDTRCEIENKKLKIILQCINELIKEYVK